MSKLLPILKWLGVPVTVLVGFFFLVQPGVEEPGCACKPPPTLEEIAAKVAEANKGDTEDSISATGWVWMAYQQRDDAKNADIWWKRALKARDPNALSFRASELMSAVNDIDGKQRKLAQLREVQFLLERIYPNRTMIEPISRSIYVDNLRSVRASIAVLQDGLVHWTALAESGEVAAAHNLARYYLYVDLDQSKRSYWEERAAKLGDPSFAWEAACCWRKTRPELLEGKSYVAAAKANVASWNQSGNDWENAVLAEKIDMVENQMNDRLTQLEL